MSQLKVMNTTPMDFFLASPSCKRFHAVAAVLERFVARAPRACHIRQLVDDTELPAAEVRRICAVLCELSLLRRVERSRGWHLARPAGEITLKHVWEAALLADTPASETRLEGDLQAVNREVVLLIDQAALAISQSIGAQLARFQLDRVNTAKWGMLCAH